MSAVKRPISVVASAASTDDEPGAKKARVVAEYVNPHPGRLLTNRHVQELKTLGYTVIEGVMPAEACPPLVEKIYDEMAARGVNWRNLSVNRSAAPQIHGIVQHLGIGQSKPVWDVRERPAVSQVFEDLYGTNDLLVSFDGLCLWRENDADDGRKWWHVDQSFRRPGRRCIQGYVNLTDCAGGLAVLPGSHLQHADFSKHFARTLEKNTDWFKFSVEEFAKMRELCGDSQPTVVLGGVGSMVLWDSRTVHMAQMATKDAPLAKRRRAVVYTCFQPRDLITQANLKKKRKAFDAFRMTTHWPASRFKLFAKQWRTYDLPQIAHDLTPEQQTRVNSDRVLELAGKTPLKTMTRKTWTGALKFVN